MARRLGEGLLSFPVTHFGVDGGFSETPYRAHCAWMLEHELTGLFAAGGTGEFFSLNSAEVIDVLGAAVAVSREVGSNVPVLSGCGYGTAIATDLARRAEKAGADGLLLLPPYLINSKQDGLAAHIEAVCRSTGLGVIVYNRDNAVVSDETLARLCERNPNLVGYKDGVGDIELMTRIYARMGDRLTYIGGLPTAETFAVPYLTMGVTTYSSAIFNFLPEWALAFYKAVLAGDQAYVLQQLKDFVLPYIALRDRGTGYAVSIVKAGCRLVGRDAGPVRTPLTELTPAELEDLRALIEKVAPKSLVEAI
ncbi:5-dehydro-4-deoxyglucarate dehydratase [Novosphingobium sp.]|uniref:5-dehydro-4-deoxyglucarate dehydratase n=1 Tax=Novosphingobium sp. TaxID=1874826 RepID=UPI00286E7922|nr:5-dehydro-4-deoxyglucarate dehydratase [Novosphingobium sp.]